MKVEDVYKEEHKTGIKSLLDDLIAYKNVIKGSSFSRIFNKETDCNKFIEWRKVKNEKDNKLELNNLTIFVGDKIDLNQIIKRVVLCGRDEEIDLNKVEVGYSFFKKTINPADVVQRSGTYSVSVAYNAVLFGETTLIVKNLEPEVLEVPDKITVYQGESKDLRKVIMRALNQRGEEVSANVKIEGDRKLSLNNGVVQANNPIGQFQVQFKLSDTCAKISIVHIEARPIQPMMIQENHKEFLFSDYYGRTISELGNIIQNALTSINSLDYTQHYDLLYCAIRTILDKSLDVVLNKIGNKKALHLEGKIKDFIEIVKGKNYKDYKTKNISNYSYKDDEAMCNNINDSRIKEIAQYLNSATHSMSQIINRDYFKILCQKEISWLIVNADTYISYIQEGERIFN